MNSKMYEHDNNRTVIVDTEDYKSKLSVWNFSYVRLNMHNYATTDSMYVQELSVSKVVDNRFHILLNM